VIDVETTLLQQFLNIAQRKRIAKVPSDRTKYESGFGLSPFEDRGSGYHFAILSRHHPANLKLQHIQPFFLPLADLKLYRSPICPEYQTSLGKSTYSMGPDVQRCEPFQ
jgi:hypothetical protein